MQKPDRSLKEILNLTEEMVEELDSNSNANAYAPPNQRHSLLEAREITHGAFEDNAIISQMLKNSFRATPGWARLADVEREAMDMIACKFGRILSGKSMERQHWEDVAGYSTLVTERCQ